MPYDPERHHRRSIRAKGYDYSQPGAYFVTVVTNGRACWLGDIADGEMRMNDIGRLVESTWFALDKRFPSLVLDAFVVMPNHIHGVVSLGAVPISGGGGHEEGTASSAPTMVAQVPSNATGDTHPHPVGASLAVPSSSPGRLVKEDRAPTLGAVMNAFKSISAIACNRALGRAGTPFWQRNYHEHIVRNERALNDIRAYIVGNPARWADDPDNAAG